MEATCSTATLQTREDANAFHAIVHALLQVADLEPDGETEGHVLKVRALMLDEQFDAAISDARALAEQHRSNHAVHEVCSLRWMVCLSQRTHVCRHLWHGNVNTHSG